MIRALALSSILAIGPASAMPECIDTEITLLADVSHSMRGDPIRIQRRGYARAFRDGDVVNRISEGACGAIAVQYVEFATDQQIMVDWRVIATGEDAEQFARAIEAAPPAQVGDTTNISGAMAFAVAEIHGNGLDAQARVVDVSSDGEATAGDPPGAVRDKHTKGPIWEQIAFNGLPIVKPGKSAENLTAYYEAQIVGGPGSFLFKSATIDNLAESIVRKLAREIG